MCNFFLFWQGTPTIFGCSKIFFCSSIKIFIPLHKVCQHFSECIRPVVLKHKVLIICVYVCAFLSVQIRLFLTHLVKRLRSIALTIHTEGSYQGWFCCCCYCYYCWSGGGVMILYGNTFIQIKSSKMFASNQSETE